VKICRLTIFGIIYISIILVSCFPVKTTNSNKRPSAGAIYNPYIQRLHPEFFVFHASQDKSRLYTKLNLSELMFAPIGPNKSYLSRMKIDYRIFPLEDLQNYADSSSVIFDVKKRKGENSAITYISINDKNYSNYYLQIITTDLLKQTRAEEFILVNKDDLANSQHYLISIKSINYPYFQNYFNQQDTFSIFHNPSTDSITISYYSEKLPLPHPPFSSLTRSALYSNPDTTWKVTGKSAFEFSGSKPGMYYLQIDTTIKSGLGLLNEGADFPNIRSSAGLIYPLEYLLSTGEFNKLLNHENKKLALDEFWLSCGKNTNRARELIRIYYNRTLYANIYFTSFTEGWRTDRGMIYLIFGPPKTVKKSPDKEIWLYSDRSNYKVLQFVFNRNPNPYSDNDYILERNFDFKTFWFQAIESWRDGKVYNVFE
jgi:GWxTD domain-containing protein